MSKIWISDGEAVNATWYSHIAYSFDNVTWQTLSKDALGVYLKKVNKNTSSPIAKKDISYVILLRHASSPNVSPALEFDLADIQNQAGWTNTIAGAQQAIEDLTTWIGDGTTPQILSGIEDISINSDAQLLSIQNLELAEDQPSVSGDSGIMMLGVRNDVLTNKTSTDGDYTAVTVDVKGRLVTVDNNGYFEVTMTTDTAIYATGDVLTDTVALTSILAGFGGAGILQSITVLDKDLQSQGLDIVILRTNVSLGTKNAAVSISDTNAEEILGIVRVSSGDFLSLTNSSVATKNSLGIGVKGDGSDTIYLSMISRGTGTYTASGLRVIVTVV